jgi:hypothetical protein
MAGKSVERKRLATDRDGSAKRNEVIDPFDDNAGRFARMQLLGWFRGFGKLRLPSFYASRGASER